MNKRALIGLPAVPIVLAAALWWMRNAAWKKTEDQFRQEAREFSNKRADAIYVYAQDLNDPKPFMEPWSRRQFSEALDDIKLMPARSSPREPLFVISVEDNSKARDSLFFNLSRTQDCGWIETNSHFGTVGRKWNSYELTPESCRALKKRIWSQFGPKLRALHIPPPR